MRLVLIVPDKQIKHNLYNFSRFRNEKPSRDRSLFFGFCLKFCIFFIESFSIYEFCNKKYVLKKYK